MRFVVTLLSLCLLAACAAQNPDPTADISFYDSRTTTGSNIPRKSTGAVIVDRSVVENQMNRQGGNLQR